MLVAVGEKLYTRQKYTHAAIEGRSIHICRIRHAASYTGRKSFELLKIIFEIKFTQYVRTFGAKLRSELRSSGERREWDRKLAVALDSMENEMHAHLQDQGSHAMSRFLCRIRRHAPTRLLPADLSRMGIKAHANGDFTREELDELSSRVMQFSSARAASIAGDVDMSVSLADSV